MSPVEGKAVQARVASLNVEPGDLPRWQRKDPALKYAWETAVSDARERGTKQGAFFLVQNNFLYHQDTETNGIKGPL